MEYKGFNEIIPSDETIKRWMYTRKLSKHEHRVIGEFSFPGFFTVQGFKTDFVLFWIAIIIEVAFLVFIGLSVGFDPLFSVIAFGLVVADITCAFFHRHGQPELCKAQLELAVIEYRVRKNLGAYDTDIIKQNKLISRLKGHWVRRLCEVVIVSIAIVKIVSVSLFLPGIGALITASILFLLVAYVHIFHTGYYVSAVRFYNYLKKDLANQTQRRQHLDERNDEKNDYHKKNIENVIANVKLREVRMAVHGANDIYDSIIQTREEENEEPLWRYRIWKHHFWDDNDLTEFISSTDNQNNPLSEEAQAFLMMDYSQRVMLGAGGRLR